MLMVSNHSAFASALSIATGILFWAVGIILAQNSVLIKNCENVTNVLQYKQKIPKVTRHIKRRKDNMIDMKVVGERLRKRLAMGYKQQKVADFIGKTRTDLLL